jgi:hypothetical protein
MTPNTTSAARQPIPAMRAATSGGATRFPALPPAEEIPTARPRRRTNHRTTVALHGTHAALIPNAAITPRPM